MGIFEKKSKNDKVIERCQDCAAYVRYASDATTLASFIDRWAMFKMGAESLDHDPIAKNCTGQAMVFLDQIMRIYNSASIYQARMREVIEKQGQISIKAVQNNLSSNVSSKVNLYLDVAKEFSDNKELFSEETLDFAQRILDRLYLTVGKDNITRQIILPEWNDTPELIGGKDSIEYVDNMNGSAFEEFCADLLKKNGFKDVSIIAKTGDPGVDIIAEKDAVRYAFQCKCYSSDLNNTPVQEVYAGKEMYGCHVGVVMTNQHFTSGAKALAEKTHVFLWGREVLISMMEKL